MSKALPYTTIIGLLLFIIIQQQCRPYRQPQPANGRDTTIIIYRDTGSVQTQPIVIYSQAQPVPKAYAPDTAYPRLLQQYNTLLKQYFTKHILHDTIRHDSSFVAITDTLLQNGITGRSSFFSIAHQQTTITETILPKPRRQVYIGGGIGSVGAFDGLQLQAGMLYKNRKDNIAGISIGIDNRGQVLYGINSYWKISFRKNTP